MTRLITGIFLLLMGIGLFAQEPPKHVKKTYKAPDGKLYIQKDLPIYLWLSTSEDEGSKKHRLFSEESQKYSNPMYLDTEGYNTVRSPSAVDPETRKTVYPLQDIIFELYADGTPPKSIIDYGETELFKEDGKINLGGGTTITLEAKDALSGVENIYFSLDSAAFKPYTNAIKVEAEKEYMLKYYSVDQVGNVEEMHKVNLVLDKTAPITKLEIEGDQHESVVSARSKLVLNSEDKGIGVKTIYYAIDSGTEKIYKTPILAGYLSQDAHTISYYSVDKVGNKEQSQSYSFYVDKTPPTIIEEVVGKTFFSGGKEFSSGKSRLKLTSIDNKAGVKEVRYSVNGGEYILYEKPVFLTQASGNLEIKSYALDFVNNRSNSQSASDKSSIPYIDLTGPDLKYALKGPEFNTRDTTFISSKTSIVLSGSDSEAGLNRIEYTVNEGNPREYTEPFNISEEGFSSINFTGFDNVENTSTKSIHVKVDNTGPEISHNFGTEPLRKQDGLDVYPSHTVLFLSGLDKVVGFQRITYSLNGASHKESSGMLKGLPKGKIELEIIAYDKLGNSTKATTSFIIE